MPQPYCAFQQTTGAARETLDVASAISMTSRYLCHSFPLPRSPSPWPRPEPQPTSAEPLRSGSGELNTTCHRAWWILVPSFESAMSTARLSTYRAVARDDDHASDLYRWYLDLVATFGPLASDAEIALRNTIHAQRRSTTSTGCESVRPYPRFVHPIRPSPPSSSTGLPKRAYYLPHGKRSHECKRQPPSGTRVSTV